MRSIRRFLAVVIPGSIALAACQSAGTKPGTPTFGVLHSSQGLGAPLTLGQVAVGNNFSVSATIGTDGGAAISGSGIWHCYAPAPPTYPNYDLEGSDNTTYGLFISIVPSSWTTGKKIIDGTNVKLLVAGADRFGAATNGSLVLTSAGSAIDTAGSTCSFYTTGGIALFGLKNG